MVAGVIMKAADAEERLFAALDSGEMGDSNDMLDKYPHSVGARDEELRVPLHYAADCADLGTFQRILNMDRSLMDAQDQFGFTPLLVAVMAGNLDVLQWLIDQGAQLGQLDREGHSAVHWAVVCGKLDALITLLRHGAPIALADIHGAHPLHYSAVNSTGVEQEEEQVPPERAEAILHVLLRHGAQLECTDLDGRTPFLWASSDGNLAAFRSLVQAGANRFATDRDRLGAIHCATSHGHAHIVREMITLLGGHSGGWALDAKDRNADTPLFYAAANGHWECAKLLLEKGANANHQDKRMRTAAHCAAAKGQLRVLKLLRQFGASFGLQNYRGDLPFHEATQTGIKEVVEWFLGIDPNFMSAPNFFGRTPLHLAAASGNMELVVLLCTRGAPVNALMLHKGELLSPLDVAKRREHPLVADYLASRHRAMSAAELPAEKREEQRNSIEERLKSAKLRKIRSEMLAAEASGGRELVVDGEGEEEQEKGGQRQFPGRRKSLWAEANGREVMVDASTMVSRRSSSASGTFRHRSGGRRKLPKATSTTDLAIQNQRPPAAERESVARGNVVAEEANMQTKTEGSSKEGEGDGGGGVTSGDSPSSAGAVEMAESPQAVINHSYQRNGTIALPKKVQLKADGVEVDEGTKRIRRRWTPARHAKEAESEESGEEGEGGITELHILEEGLSPPALQQSLGRLSTFAASGHPPPRLATRRFIHEKAIFDELTHLKRMQLQYGRVREGVLVRSLIQNFCRMHAIHPSHFRHLNTFHQWEKFLYDQLKMLYLEERDRISVAAAAAAQRAAAAAGVAGGIRSQGVLYSARQRVFAVGASVPSASSPLTAAALMQRKFSARVARTDPLEERMHQLSRIYGSGSSSRNSAANAAQPLAANVRRQAESKGTNTPSGKPRGRNCRREGRLEEKSEGQTQI